MMRKMIAMGMIASILVFTGCSAVGESKSEEKEKTQTEVEAGENKASQTVSKKRTIQLGHIDPAQDVDPYHTLAINFKNNLEEVSGGAITVDVISDAQLGSELSMMEGMNMGTIDMAVITNFSFSSSVPEFSVFDLPYLFLNKDQAYAVLDDNEITGGMEEKLYQDFGVKVLCWGEGGFRSTINKKRPIYTPDDLCSATRILRNRDKINDNN